MRIPSCFSGNPSSPTCKSKFQMPQNLITSIYLTHLFNTPTYLTLTWSKTLHSHSLTILASDSSFSITISLQPSSFSFFLSPRHRRGLAGSKTISLGHTNHHHHKVLSVFWDFTRAKFSKNSAEPDSCFYLAISCNSIIQFFLGDLHDEASRRSKGAGIRECLPPATLLSRREHVFGKKSYGTRAKFLGSESHEIGIECSGGELKVKVDGEVGLIVKRLGWKFRGNERIMVGGSDVEFYWDVYNWIASSSSSSSSSCDESSKVLNDGHGVFVFQVGDGGVWPEMVGLEKRLMKRKTLRSSSSAAAAMVECSPSPSSSSVLQWAEESSSDGGRSSCASSSTRSCGSTGGGFSLLLYAWRSD